MDPEYKNAGCLFLGIAGHAARTAGYKTAKEYDNPFTDFVNLVIAESKTKLNREARLNNNETDKEI